MQGNSFIGEYSAKRHVILHSFIWQLWPHNVYLWWPCSDKKKKKKRERHGAFQMHPSKRADKYSPQNRPSSDWSAQSLLPSQIWWGCRQVDVSLAHGCVGGLHMDEVHESSSELSSQSLSPSQTQLLLMHFPRSKNPQTQLAIEPTWVFLGKHINTPKRNEKDIKGKKNKCCITAKGRT